MKQYEKGGKMLKIKDNVDLKQLEKFGFEKYNYDNFYHNGKVRVANNGSIRIVAKGSSYDIDVIFDLIQANLVEKVAS